MKTYINLITIALLLLFIRCTKEGSDGKNSLLDFISEPSGTNCSYGGYKINSGLDENDNNILDSLEIQETEYICNGAPGFMWESDKEIRLFFNNAVWTTTNTEWELAPENTYLISFNKLNYASVDSIVFFATLRVQNGDAGNTCQVRLFNKTDNIAISNSEIETTSRTLIWVNTENIVNELPESKIDIGIEIKSSNGSGWVQVDTPMLILYRD